MMLFMDVTNMQRKMLSRYDNLASQRYQSLRSFLLLTFWYTSSIYHQKEENTKRQCLPVGQATIRKR